MNLIKLGPLKDSINIRMIIMTHDTIYLIPHKWFSRQTSMIIIIF